MTTTEPRPRNLRLPTPGCYADSDRSGLMADDVFDGMTEHLFYTLGRRADQASIHDLYLALSHAVRDRLMTCHLGLKVPCESTLARRWPIFPLSF